MKTQITTSLNHFDQSKLIESSKNLLKTLGYQSERTFEDLYLTPDNLAEKFGAAVELSPEKAFTDEWQQVAFLFQLTGEDLNTSMQRGFAFDGEYNPTIYQSYLFFAIKLQGQEYSRTKLSSITREVNRLFLMPAMVVFAYADKVSLAIIHRRPNKVNNDKDVLEKVTLIKDINLAKPHRAHVEILHDLALPTLTQRKAFKNFLELHEAWQKVLNVTELNKNFFKKLSNWYFWAVDRCVFPQEAGDDDTRNPTSVIRLITRIIFVWFIKEKGLVPDALFEEATIKTLLKTLNMEDTNYYKAILQNLFFATLNQEMGDKRNFRKDLEGWKSPHYGVSNHYRYESMFRDPQAALCHFADVPFLNGGLFDCLDSEREEGETVPDGCEQKIRRVDGFSDRAQNPVHVPNELFFLKDEKIVDLNAIYGTSNKTYKVTGLIELLNSYKFTIEENTPLDQEIALDPELLGRVFENLLAQYNPETGVSARKQTGSFYTPREIVNFMVDESLIAYLNDKLEEEFPAPVKPAASFGVSTQGVLLGSSQSTLSISETKQEDEEPATEGRFEARLRDLFAYTEKGHAFSDGEVKALIQAIDTIKVLDPACGSGAFPMGILHRLVDLLAKLDPHNQEWRSRQLDKITEMMMTAGEISDPKTREDMMTDLEEQVESINDAFANNELDYGRKLFLIENCIFGVDIQPIAVQIAKLRFFISLIVDQRVDDGKDNRNIRPLPNLETKFVAANTLIGLEKPDKGTQLGLRNLNVVELEKQLKRLRQQHFSAKNRAQKKRIQQQDKETREALQQLLINDGWAKENALKLAAWDPYQANVSSSFFDSEWMFGVAKGFDVVIGNPPYMRVQGIQKNQSKFIPYYKKNYKSTTGSYDLYAIFIECGYSLLNEHGQLAYIVPHKFFQAKFGEGLRTLLTRNKALNRIVRFGSEQVFDEATTYTCLLFLSDMPNTSFELLEVNSLARSDDLFPAMFHRRSFPDYAREMLPEPGIETEGKKEKTDWNFVIGKDRKVLERINQHRIHLGDITRKMFQGIATGADKVFVLEIIRENHTTLECFSKHLDCSIEIEKDFVKKFLMGKNIHRYDMPIANNVVIFPYLIDHGKVTLMPQSTIKENYPLGWKYLLQCKARLFEREKGRFANNWYCFSRPQNLSEFEAIKIMTPDICSGPQMTIDQIGTLYHTTTLYSFVFNTKASENVKYYLGLLNSKLLFYFMSMTGTVLRGGYLRFKTEYLKPFPIAQTTFEQEIMVETLVDYVLHLKSLPKPANRHEAARLRLMVAYFEQLIDAVIYEIYFPEEFSDANTSMSELLTKNLLPALSDLGNQKFDELEKIFNKLYSKNHPVRQALFFLDTIEAVRVIEERAAQK